MVAWGTLKALVLQLLDESRITPTPDRSVEVNGALRLFANHTAVQGVYETTAETVNDYVVTMPGDFMQINGVYVPSSGHYLEQFGVLPGGSYDSIGWFEWPKGTLRVIGPAEDLGIAVMYYGYYPEVTDEEVDLDGDPVSIPIPNWAIYPVACLAAYYAHIPESVARSDLSQWNTKIDQGNPEHNPLMKQALFLWDRYFAEISKWPRQSIQIKTA